MAVDRSMIAVLALVVSSALLAGVAEAQGRIDIGKREYDGNCASCHGVSGRGDGPMARHLVTPPSDLTQLRRRNGGVFPTQRIAEAIDGRALNEIGPHGSREMPVWGDVYRARGAQAGAAEIDEEWYARGRLLALLDYLSRIQQR
jgi:mono/diheme cytochrome c family protein